MTSKRKRSIAAGLAMVGILAMCEKQPRIATDGGSSASGLARLELIKGQVLLERSGETRPVALETLFANDALETGADGEAHLRFRDGRLVEMGANARLSIHVERTEIVVSIAHGLVLSHPSEAEAGDGGTTVALNILTPFGLTRVGDARNAVSVDVQMDGGTVDVLVGDVEFVAKDGQTSRLGAGGKLVLGIGSPEFLEIKPQTRMLSALAIKDRGAVELRPSRHPAWAELPFKPYRLSTGDSLRSRTGAVGIQVEGSGARITFGAGSQFDFGGATQEGNKRQLRIVGLDGNLIFSLVDRENLTVALDDAEFDVQGPAYATIAKGKGSLAIDAVAGDVVFRRGPESHVVRAGTLWRGADGQPIEEGESPPAPLRLPAETDVRVFHPNLSEATLAWTDKPGDFLVAVSSDARFGALVLAGVVHRPQIRVPIPARGPLFWRISDPLDRRVLFQGNAIFRPETARRELAEIRHEVPDGVEQTTIYYQDKPPALTFKFGPYVDAAAYRLAIYRRERLEQPIVERIVGGNSVSLRAGTLDDGAYVWSATPLGKDGEPLIGGRMNRLEIAYDNSVPSLAIKSPKNGEVAKPTGVLVSGAAPVGTQVFIDGQSISLDRFHRFSLRVAPTGHPPVVVFQLAAASKPPLFIARALAEPQ